MMDMMNKNRAQKVSLLLLGECMQMCVAIVKHTHTHTYIVHTRVKRNEIKMTNGDIGRPERKREADQLLVQRQCLFYCPPYLNSVACIIQQKIINFFFSLYHFWLHCAHTHVLSVMQTIQVNVRALLRWPSCCPQWQTTTITSKTLKIF